MTAQPFAHRSLYTQGREIRSLVHILKNEDHVQQRGLYDLDGSLHRGFFPAKLKGISNADLAIYLFFHIPLSKTFSFLHEGIHIYQYEKEHITPEKEEERQIHISYLVQTFKELLLDLPEQTVRQGIQFLPHLCYPHAKKVLGEIKAEGTIISCGFQPVAQVYANFLGIQKCYGNALFPQDTRQHGNISGAEDKKRIALSIPADRYIVIGDTADDIGLAHAAKEKNPESIVISIHRRSEALESEADLILSSWKDLGELLEMANSKSSFF